MPNPGVVNYLSSVAVRAANDVWAAGAADSATLIEHWDGKVWRVVPSPNHANAYNSLSGVAWVPATHDVWAVGSSSGQSAPYAQQTLIEFKG